MKLSIISTLALACAVTASRQGESRMAHLMSLKLEHRERARSQGLFKVNKYIDQGSTKCVDGKAGEYSCENVDLQGFLSHQALGSTTREGNDLWGIFLSLYVYVYTKIWLNIMKGRTLVTSC